MQIDQYFDAIYVINLANRQDRWQNLQYNFANYGVDDFERFIAVTPDDNCETQKKLRQQIAPFFHEDLQKMVPGTVACLLSHIGIIKLAQSRNQQRILICEDDCILTEEFPQLWPMISDELQSQSWDMLYLGGKLDKKSRAKKISKHLSHRDHIKETHCYALDHRLFDTILKLENNAVKSIDVHYGEDIQPHCTTLVTEPLIARQTSSYSDIAGHYVDRPVQHSKRKILGIF